MKVFLLGIVLPIAILIFAVILNIQGILLSIVSGLSFTFSFIIFMAYFFETNTSSYKFKSINLYDWMNEPENDYEHLLTILKSQHSRYRTIDNLKTIKNTIMKQASGDLESLKLYKAFYNQVLKENTEELYFKTALIILSSLAVFVVRDYISGIGSGNKVIGFMIFFWFLIAVSFISHKIIGNKKRVGLLIEILEVCIDDIENKNKK